MKQKYAIELSEIINEKDFMYLRNLYTPIIGSDAANFFSVLTDYSKLSIDKNSFYNIKDFSDLLQLKMNDILLLFKKLEAVGLVKNYEKSDNSTHIVSVLKPLNPRKFKNNSLLFKELKSKVGELAIERIMFFDLPKTFDKSEYKDVSTKYQDMFDISFDNEQTNTLEIDLNTSNISIESALKTLSYAQFIKFISGSKITQSQLNGFDKLSNIGFSNSSLNLLSDFSYQKNGKIVMAYINAIAKDLVSKEVISFHDIKAELSFKNTVEKQSTANKFKLSNIKKDEIKDSKNNGQSWDDIFEALGGGL